MSNIYIQEPPTQGKICLETTVGDIEIELFSRECPKACRNFVQLCLENYYDKTKFHRVVKEFIVQGGDPTGTGEGGESIYGATFKDEFHSRLRFTRRGLVAMANAGKDDNGSQFFFTMASTPELQNKHTIFGKVVGDTLYNMIKLQEGIVEDDRPLQANRILRTKVLINPFPDIQPRKMIQSMLEDDEDAKKDKKGKSKMKATKDFKLLSFGDEAEEDEENFAKTVPPKVKSKSAHDLLNDEKLSKATGLEFGIKGDAEMSSKKQEEKSADIDSIRSKLSKNATKDPKKPQFEAPKPRKDESRKSKNVEKKTANVPEPEEFATEEEANEAKREKILREIKALKKDLKNPKSNSINNEVEEETKGKKRQLTEEEKANDLLHSYHEEQMKYSKKPKAPKKGSAREEMTLALLNKFTSKLRSVTEETEEAPTKKSADKKTEEEDDDEDDSWLGHQLKFANDDPVRAKDASTKDDDWFDIFDPRNPLAKRRREQNAKKK